MARTRESSTVRPEDLAPLIDESKAARATIWSEATKKKHEADFARFLAWLARSNRPQTTESLSFAALVQYVDDLLHQPAVHGVWRGDSGSVKKARAAAGRTLSRNTVHSYLSPLRTLCSYLSSEGILADDPFRRRGRARSGVSKCRIRSRGPSGPCWTAGLAAAS